MNEQVIQELLAPVLPEKEEVFPQAEEKGLLAESEASVLLSELPDQKQEPEPSPAGPIPDMEEGNTASGEVPQLSAPPVAEELSLD